MKTINDEMMMMERYGITCEQKPIYFYKNHRYEQLKDALNFAKIDDIHPDTNVTADSQSDDQRQQYK